MNTTNDYVLLELCAMHDVAWEISLTGANNAAHREVEDLARVITRLSPPGASCRHACQARSGAEAHARLDASGTYRR